MSLFPNKQKVGMTIFTSRPDSFEYEILITVDATLSETHSSSATVTSHPVEGGESITDHVQRKPRALSMTITHSATPLARTGEPFRVENAHEAFKRALNDGVPLRVISSLEDYGSLVLTKYSVIRDRTTANELRANLEFQEVRIISPETVKIPAKVVALSKRASGKSKSKTGKNSTKEAKSKETEKAKEAVKGSSVAFSVFN